MKNILDMACFSGKDLNKDHNEDLYLPPTYDKKFNIVFAVADGVGASNDAKQASKIAIEAVRETLYLNEFNIDSAFEKAKKAIDELEIDTATTLTVVHVTQEEILIGHLGDCRLYYRKNNKLKQITRDQTRYQDLLDSGEHKMKNLRNHKERLSTILTSALSRKVEPKFEKLSIPFKDVEEDGVISLFLMSDGAYKHWHARPSFSEKTMKSSSAFCSSLKKRIEKKILDDYTLIALNLS
ncbi:protein phosphatase 2C domain-containing protein [Pantoea sp. SM3640]|uniref:PP2C family protein-serine/threonine phosphatase n=1 Tax=Pantoea sp. SM3640 TaxID=2787629 RepID=UPI0018A6D621|nr:protein phosphatase 2C domain-containing protein [Pantoea sp. SM3640]QPG28601.1 protein phosphatase 2C domain-containing protein [Pantoea sp. SM3640]